MQDHAAFALLLDPSLQSEKNTDGWQKIRLIFGLAELSRKLKKIAALKIRLITNNFG